MILIMLSGLCPYLYSQISVNLPSSLASSTAIVDTIITDLSFTEGPASDGLGNVYFTDVWGNTIWKVTPDGASSKFRENSDSANGLVFDQQGRLIACESNRVTRTESSGSITILAEGDSIDSPNDLTLSSDGGMFITVPGDWGDYYGELYFRSSQGNVSKKATYSDYPNGIEYIEEDKIIYVALSRGDKLLKYTVDNNFNLAGESDFANLVQPDGIAIDVNKNIWVAHLESGEGMVSVFSPDGTKLGDISFTGEGASNLAFAGIDNKSLYITTGADGSLYKVQLNIAGRKTTGEIPVANVKWSNANQNSNKIIYELGKFYDVLGRNYSDNSSFPIHKIIPVLDQKNSP